MPQEPLLPFIQWVGGKRWACPQLEEIMTSSYGRYFEPFMGGAALFFHTRPEKAVLCDFNSRLVKMYRGVRDNVEDVIELLSMFKREEVFYQEMRALSHVPLGNSYGSAYIDNTPSTFVAAWFLYINRTSFNALYRENSKGEFNVPMGTYTDNPFYNAENLRTASLALKQVSLMHQDFRTIERQAKAGDFVYFDPPYAPLSATSDFTSYGRTGFGPEDQVDLAEMFFRLQAKGVYVIASNSSAPLIYDLYKGAKILEVDVKRTINSDPTKRGAVKELIIY